MPEKNLYLHLKESNLLSITPELPHLSTTPDQGHLPLYELVTNTTDMAQVLIEQCISADEGDDTSGALHELDIIGRAWKSFYLEAYKARDLPVCQFVYSVVFENTFGDLIDDPEIHHPDSIANVQ